MEAVMEQSVEIERLTYDLVAIFGEKYGMTPREREVFGQLVRFGFRNDDMGELLHISSKTLKNHLACLMRKTRSRSSRELQAMFLNFALHQCLMPKQGSALIAKSS